MISYFVNDNNGEQMNSKKIRVGCNIWVFAKSYGYVVQLEQYHCVKEDEKAAFFTTFFRLFTHPGVNHFWATVVFNKALSLGRTNSRKKKKKKKDRKKKRGKKAIQHLSSKKAWLERQEKGGKSYGPKTLDSCFNKVEEKYIQGQQPN